LDKIKKAEILAKLKQKAGADWLPVIYRDKIRVLRTRVMPLNVPLKENRTDILYTLLGIELKVGKQRIACPDLATARYLQVFARLGCAIVAIPYDITKISVLADELEHAWQRLLLLLEQAENHLPTQIRSLRSTLVRELRREIEEIGAGDAVPQFNQNTKQRRSRTD
jgi:hypothetical protein